MLRKEAVEVKTIQKGIYMSLFKRRSLPESRAWKIRGFISTTLLTGVFFVFSFGYCGADETVDTKLPSVEIEYGYPDQSIFVATTNDKGQPNTPMTLVAEALMTRAGLSWHATPYPASRLFENLKSGTTNFSILVRAPSLRDSCIFSSAPIYSTTLNVYSMENKPPAKSKEDLIGKHIITIGGYSYGGLRKFISDPANNIVSEPAKTHKAAFEMLVDSRADYLVDYASAADHILSRTPVKGLNATTIGQLDIFLILSKSYPDATHLMIKLEKIAATLDVNDIVKRQEK